MIASKYFIINNIYYTGLATAVVLSGSQFIVGWFDYFPKYICLSKMSHADNNFGGWYWRNVQRL